MSIDPELRARLRGKQLTDVLAAGYLDEQAGVRRFHPMFENLYLEFEDVLLKVSAVGQYWNVALQSVGSIECEFDLDEDDEFCTASIRHQALHDPDGSHYLASWRAFLRPDGGIARLVLYFDGGSPGTASELLFIDPENTHGLRLGGQCDLDRWLEEVDVSEFREESLHIDATSV